MNKSQTIHEQPNFLEYGYTQIKSEKDTLEA